MSYASSPSAHLVATRCAACGRALSDAPSIESGLGPDCREKHGYAAPDVSGEWEAVRALLAPHLAALALPEGWDGDERRAANLLVHRIAVEQDGALAIACSNAVRALGYRRLAERVARRMARIQLWEEGGSLFVRAPASDGLRRIPWSSWAEDAKALRVEVRGTLTKLTVLEVLKLAYPGQLVSGPKGLFVLPRKDPSAA